jgi:flagellar hook-length control protein FliK
VLEVSDAGQSTELHSDEPGKSRDETVAADDQPASLLQSIAPVVLTLVPVAPVEAKAANATQEPASRDPVSAAVSALIAPSAGGAATAPTATANVPNAPAATADSGVAQTRLPAVAPPLPGTTANASTVSTDTASSPVTTAATDAGRGNGARDIPVIAGDRAATLLAPQWQSMPAMSMSGTETIPTSAPAPTEAAARQSLTAALGDRLHVQINQRSEHAVIRLDPPSMGSIEIVIRQEAGELHVQLRATHSEVARQLHAIGDSLRQDLNQRQQSDVSVQVWDDSRGNSEGRRQRPATPWQDDPGHALSEASDGEEPATFAFAADGRE